MKKLLVFVFIFVLAIGFLLAQESSLIILPNKNVGINTETPSSELEVNGRIKDKTGFVMPVGTILPYGGATAPEGWLFCDGEAYSLTEQPELQDLYDAIGILWGDGTKDKDGQAVYKDVNVPDLRGRFLRGLDTTTAGSPVDPDRGSRKNKEGQIVGNTVGSYQEDAFQGHRHYVYTDVQRSSLQSIESNASGGYYAASRITQGSATVRGYFQVHDPRDGANGSIRVSNETRPTNAAIPFIIKY